jgi:hypothetical protein
MTAEVVKVSGQEVSVMRNTRHLPKKAPPPPGTAMTMKRLSQAQTKKPAAIRVGAMTEKNPHPTQQQEQPANHQHGRAAAKQVGAMTEKNPHPTQQQEQPASHQRHERAATDQLLGWANCPLPVTAMTACPHAGDQQPWPRLARPAQHRRKTCWAPRSKPPPQRKNPRRGPVTWEHCTAGHHQRGLALPWTSAEGRHQLQ